jgi:hypothetical protein
VSVSQRRSRVRWIAETRTFRALDLVFDVRTTDVQLATFLDRAFGSLPTTDASDPGRVRFGIASTPTADVPTRHRVYRRGRIAAEAVGPSQALARLLSAINGAVVRASGERRVLLHAALVADDRGSTLVVGRSGAGKTTLTALLLKAGAHYLTDEVVAVDVRTGEVDGFRRPLVVKPFSVWAVEQESPRPAGLERYLGASRVVPVADLGAGTIDEVPPVRRVVLPRYEDRTPAAMTSTSRAQMLAQLPTHSWHLRRHGRAGFRALARLVERTGSCVELTYGDVRDAAILLSGD